MGEVDEFLGSMTCPRCGEYSDNITDSVYFPGKACDVCDLIEQRHHLDEGCFTPGCPCLNIPRPFDREGR